MASGPFTFLPGALRQGGADAGAPAPAPPLSLSMSHNSTEGMTEGEGGQTNKLTGSQRRMAHVLSLEIIELARRYGIEKLGFLTLTFSDQVTSMEDGQRRFNSLNTHILRGRYKRSLGVWERQKSSRLHIHLVVATGADIRSGVDFGAIARGDYRGAGPDLRAGWAFWRKTAPRYRFGRTELLPVKSTAEGIARYVGGYIKKGIGGKLAEDRGHRVVRFIGYGPGQRRATASFSWNTDHAWLWRQKVKLFSESVGASDTCELSRMFGTRWAFHLQAQILALHVPMSRSRVCAEKQWVDEAKIIEAKWRAQEEVERRSNGGRVYHLRKA